MTSPSLAQASPPQLPAQPASNPEPTSPTASTPNEAEAKIHDTHASYQFTHYPPYGQYVPATQAGFPQHDYAVDPQLSRPSIGSNGEPGNVQGYTGAQAAMTGFASPPATGAPSPPGTDKKKATQACDRCKNKKTRCTHAPGSPSCKACTKAGVQCEYTHEAQKRGPEKGAHKNLVAQVDELRAEMEQMKHDHSMELASLRQGLDELQKAFMEWVGAAPPAPTPKQSLSDEAREAVEVLMAGSKRRAEDDLINGGVEKRQRTEEVAREASSVQEAVADAAKRALESQ